jgi:hypothetical protein
MQLTEAIAQHVLDVHEGNNWTEVAIRPTLQDVTWREATTQTPASPNTIASLLHHLTFWNRVMARRAQGLGTEVGPANGFDVAAIQNEADWQALLADNYQSAHELAAAIRSFDEAQLPAPILPAYGSAYKNLQGAVEHLHYHLGQLVLLKNLVRSTHEPTQ